MTEETNTLGVSWWLRWCGFDLGLGTCAYSSREEEGKETNLKKKKKKGLAKASLIILACNFTFCFYIRD